MGKGFKVHKFNQIENGLLWCIEFSQGLSKEHRQVDLNFYRFMVFREIFQEHHQTLKSAPFKTKME